MVKGWISNMSPTLNYKYTSKKYLGYACNLKYLYYVIHTIESWHSNVNKHGILLINWIIGWPSDLFKIKLKLKI